MGKKSLLKTAFKACLIGAMGFTTATVISGCSAEDLDELFEPDPQNISYDIQMIENTKMYLDLRTGSYYAIDLNETIDVPTTGTPTTDYGYVTYNITKKPDHGVAYIVSGVVEYTPNTGYLGGDSMKVEKDSEDPYERANYSINFTVKEKPFVNTPPSIAGLPATSIGFNMSYTFTPVASDPDGDVLTFAIENQPDWCTFDTNTGTLSGTTPSTANAYPSIVIAVTDGTDWAYLPAFTITVEDTNQAPYFDENKVPSTVVALGEEYDYTPIAHDPDGDPLTFSIANKPTWCTFDETTGNLNGVPTDENLSGTTTAPITISVFDDKGASDAMSSFSITIE